MNRLEKQNLIAELRDVFSTSSSVIVVHYKGLTVAQIEELRDKVSDSKIGFRVVKNSLASLAIKDTQNSILDEFFVGPSAIAWGEDPISCAKTISEFAKKNESLVVIGGAYNSTKLSATDVKVLSNLPSMDELRGQLVGIFTSVARKIAVISKTPATNVIGVLKAYSQKV